MSNTAEVFSKGYQQWETRFQRQNAADPPLQGQVAREVRLAVEAYRARYGDAAARAVDIGAGDGRHTLYLAAQGFDVLAVDAAPSGISLIQQKLQHDSLHADLHVADLREFELPDAIDLLVASYVIHLLPDPYEQIHRWQDKIRPGGICSVATRGRFPHDPAEYWFPADFELKQMFLAAGWQVLHAREEDNWQSNLHGDFRQRAVVAVKPQASQRIE